MATALSLSRLMSNKLESGIKSGMNSIGSFIKETMTEPSPYKNLVLLGEEEMAPVVRNYKKVGGGIGKKVSRHGEAEAVLESKIPDPIPPSAPKSIDRAMFEKKQGISKGQAYQIDQTNGQYGADLDALHDAGARKEIAKRYNIQGHEKMDTDQFANAVHSYHADKLKAGPSTMDNIVGNKYHTKAAGGLITAGVVSSLSNSKGQQSNGQLYSQAPSPGM
jgi:hypothetical protein